MAHERNGQWTLESIYKDIDSDKITGLVMLFFIWLISFNVIDIFYLGLTSTFSIGNTFSKIGYKTLASYYYIIVMLVVFFAVLGILLSVLFYKVKTYSIKLLKIYLIVKFVLLAVLLIADYILDLKFNNGSFSRTMDFIPQLLYPIICFTLPFVYLKKSKRVKTTYLINE